MDCDKLNLNKVADFIVSKILKMYNSFFHKSKLHSALLFEAVAEYHMDLKDHVPPTPAFPSACDSQGGSSPCPPSQPSLPSCHADATRLEQEYVHRVYDAIASHFSSTRHTPWPRVCHFLSALQPGSVLADVGCGNGKYLGVNPQLITVGMHIVQERVCDP